MSLYIKCFAVLFYFENTCRFYNMKLVAIWSLLSDQSFRTKHWFLFCLVYTRVLYRRLTWHAYQGNLQPNRENSDVILFIQDMTQCCSIILQFSYLSSKAGEQWTIVLPCTHWKTCQVNRRKSGMVAFWSTRILSCSRTTVVRCMCAVMFSS